jgi:hypothetical protein
MNNFVSFYWSQNEVNTAKQLGKEYWIYILTNFNTKEPEKVRLVTVEDPYKNIFNNESYHKECLMKYYFENVIK